MKEKIRILYIDKETHNLRAFYANFRTEINFEILICHSFEEGISILNAQQIHILITDRLMPFMTEMAFWQNANISYPEPVKIVLTASRDISAIENAKNKGLIYAYYSKPYNIETLKTTIEDGRKLNYKN